MEYNTKREQFIKELRVDQNTLDNLARVPANARHAQSSSSESGTKGQLERELGKTTQFEKDFSIEQSNTLNNNNNNAAAVREGQNEEGKDEQIQQGQEQQEQEQKGEEQGQQENEETIAIIGELEEEEDELDIEEEELDMDDENIDLDVDMNYDMDDDREL
ncbi:hypothetical protein DWY36_18545 [Firmicutes bacterium AF25-13AC]|nr:hypothetical protein DWY36_18545 [Firmicutes bacterium AF25-13AC]